MISEDEEDRIDVEIAERRLSDPSEIPIPYERVRRELGILGVAAAFKFADDSRRDAATLRYETITDNFAHIIAARQAEADRKTRWEKHLDEWAARQERERPGWTLVGLSALAAILILAYFTWSP